MADYKDTTARPAESTDVSEDKNVWEDMGSSQNTAGVCWRNGFRGLRMLFPACLRRRSSKTGG